MAEVPSGAVTKAELEQGLADVKTELRAGIKQSANDVKTELRAEMNTMEMRLHAHIDQATHDAAKHFANVVIEEVQRMIAPLDDKIEAVRADLDAHVTAPGLHGKRRR